MILISIWLLFVGIVFQRKLVRARLLERLRIKSLEEENATLKIQLGLPPERRFALYPADIPTNSSIVDVAAKAEVSPARGPRPLSSTSLASALLPMVGVGAALLLLSAKKKKNGKPKAEGTDRGQPSLSRSIKRPRRSPIRREGATKES